MLKDEFIEQYRHTWRILEGVGKDFDDESWLHTGRGVITPARIAFHILQGVKYYTEDSSTVIFASGKSFEGDWWAVKEEELPSQSDILQCMNELEAKTEKWLLETIPSPKFLNVGESPIYRG